MSLRESLVTDITKGLQEAAEKLSIPAPITWIEKEFLIPETRNDPMLRGRLHLQPYQRDVLLEALTPDDKGNFKYSIIVWSDIKKSIKSTIAAAVNIYRATHTEYGEFYVVANDLKQADSRVAHYIRRCVQLNPKMQKRYQQQGYRITTPAGSFIEAVPIDPSGEAGSNADMVTFCLDHETEVLTRDGWKGWETLCKNDWVATRSKDGKFEWQKPVYIYCKQYDGWMYRINHRSLDMLVTPDHRMYGKFIGGRGIAPASQNCESTEFVSSLENIFLPARDAYKTKGFFPVTTSIWDGGETKSIFIPPTYAGMHGKIIQPELTIGPRDYAEFMGWYLSEGCVIKKRGRIDGIFIGQSRKINHEKCDQIISLLERMGLHPHEHANSNGIVVYHSKLGEMLLKYGLSAEKYIPNDIKNLPLKYLQLFLNAYVEGDGCRNRCGGILISSRSPTLRDDIVEIAQKCGYSIYSYECVDRRWKNFPIMYYAYLRSKSTWKRKTKIERRHWEKVYHHGMVYCPSTPNGVIYIRRNGKYSWTGNSELWGANEDAKMKMWVEMTIPPAKHGRAFRWVESYAGFAEESDLLYSLYELGAKQGELLWPDRLYDVTDGVPTPLELYVNREAGLLCLWNTQPRCPWQTKEYYKSEEMILPPNQFLRVHRNQWVSSTETFVPMEWWHACRRSDEEWPQNFRRDENNKNVHPHVLALDAATSNDNFGMWMGCRHPDRKDDILTVFSQKWVPGKSGKIDFVGTDEHPGPEMVVERLIKEYNIIEVCYDPYQLHDFAMRMKQKGVAWFREFSQGQDRLKADSQFRDLIRDRRFWHRGEVDLAEHVQNANAKLDDQDSKIRLVKRAERMKIDLAVAASMGSHELLRLNL